MENLLLLLFFISPILFFISLYRFWRLITRQITFRNRILDITYTLLLIFVILCFLYFGSQFYRCVWPNKCGEGFASGYIAAGVLFSIAVTSIMYLITEAVHIFSVKKRTRGDVT